MVYGCIRLQSNSILHDCKVSKNKIKSVKNQALKGIGNNKFDNKDIQTEIVIPEKKETNLNSPKESSSMTGINKSIIVLQRAAPTS